MHPHEHVRLSYFVCSWASHPYGVVFAVRPERGQWCIRVKGRSLDLQFGVLSRIVPTDKTGALIV